MTTRLLLLACLLLGRPALGADPVDGYVQDFIKAQHIPGLSLAVVRDGKLVKAGGYGVSNLELNTKATPETAYEIGSITKTFTAQALLLLQQDGRLALDDKLGRHLDALPTAWEPLTLRQLLSHTSGLKDWEEPGLLDFRREYTPREYIATMASYPLDFAPGTRWSYTNTAYPLLGMVVAAASGKPYHELVAERIFAPLGMGATRFSRPEEIVPQRASGYVEVDGKLRRGEPLRPRVLEPNGGILSTVLDLARWERTLRDATLLKPESLAEMETITKLANGQGTPAGLGLFIDAYRKHRLFVHNGSTPGGFSSVFYHWPDDKLTVIVLCNIDRGDAVNRVAAHVAGVFVPGLDMFAK